MSNDYDKVNGHTKPEWLKIKLPQQGDAYAETARIVRQHALNTICSSAMCPNKAECWGRRTATFMILGDACTRNCKFCATKTGNPLPADSDEPKRIADSIRLMGIRHAVITSVTRDDLADGGARHWAAVVGTVRAVNPQTTIELLIPDLCADAGLLDIIIASSPDVIGHNIETVERLTPQVRSRARYDVSLAVLRHIAARGAVPKSGIMVGMGETEDEVLQTLDDLCEAGCRIVTLGQYLRPTLKHLPVAEYVTPEKFETYREAALARGFDYVASAPLVRSSYMAERAVAAATLTSKGVRH
ncbi:MAG: lipoyl synthase [Rikenellaceae bacterium]|nr:lipoyl synthase [Rikenellaceae bacterium]MCL2692990.1 lipoyl synthase [Rikenellaceae bacterium]